MVGRLDGARTTETYLNHPETPFELTREGLQESGPLRLTGRGELDSGTAQALSAAFEQAAPAPAVMIDLSQVSFIDSAGMRVLIAIQQEAEQRGIELTVVPPPEPVTQLLEMAGVAGRLRLVPEAEVVPRESMFLERVAFEFPADARAPSRARRALREALGATVDESVLETLVLMASEVVSNSVLHGGADGSPVVGLRILTFPEAVRIEVDDAGPGFDPTQDLPSAEQVPDPDEGGRGLFVVDRCASRWGARRSETDRGRRFSVWFEVDLAAAAAPSS
jgi:anti-anti-sigma factor